MKCFVAKFCDETLQNDPACKNCKKQKQKCFDKTLPQSAFKTYRQPLAQEISKKLKTFSKASYAIEERTLRQSLGCFQKRNFFVHTKCIYSIVYRCFLNAGGTAFVFEHKRQYEKLCLSLLSTLDSRESLNDLEKDFSSFR